MKDEKKSKAQLLIELAELRDRVAALEGGVSMPAMEQGDPEGSPAPGRVLKKETSSLLQHACQVLECGEFRDAAQSIVDRCSRILGAERAALVLAAKDGRSQAVIASRPAGASLRAGRAMIGAPDGWPGEAVILRRGAEGACGTGRRRGRASGAGHGVGKEVLAAPLVIESKTVGLLILEGRPGGFDRRDVETASAFGRLASVALDHSQAMDELAIGVEFFRSVVQTANDAIISSDSRAKIIFWNRAAERIFGYRAEEIVGKPMTRIMPERLRSDHLDLVNRVTASGGGNGSGKTIETTGLRKDGSEFPMELSLGTWKTREGTLVTGIYRDITDRKLVEEALKRSKEEAEVANRAKSEFLANMSHEIRTPLNAIVGMADLLWDTPLSPDQRQYVQLLAAAGDNLLNLINDILDLSKLEAGHQLKLDAVAFDPCRLVEKTCELMALRAHEKGLELACRVMPGVPARVVGDPLRLRQILVNLLGNAIKFTQKGEVVVCIEPRGATGGRRGAGKEAGGIELLFSVADTGIGIPPERREEIFESFTQGDHPDSAHLGGTGLGLSISRRLVALMGGRIWVHSEVGRGSRFCFTARFQRPEGRTASAGPEPVDLKGLRALVVDDSATNRLILMEMLGGWGMSAKEASSGRKALLELRRAKQRSEPFHLLLLDCRMPGMGGFQVAEHIKDDPALAGVTLMILTSDHRHEDIVRCKELGLGGYLVKPVKRLELRDAVAAAMGGAQKSPDDPLPRGDEPIRISGDRKLRILLVEDSSDNQLLIKAFLKNAPCTVDTAENGAVAVAMFQKRVYDLVLMDMQMPVMDGYAATRRIRRWEARQGRLPVPVVALTAYAFKEDVQKSLDAGCTAHVTKPIKKAVLIETVRKYAGGMEREGSNAGANRNQEAAQGKG